MWGEDERPGKQNPNHTPRLVSLSCCRFLNWVALLSPELGQRRMFCVSHSSKMDFKSVSGRRWEPLPLLRVRQSSPPNPNPSQSGQVSALLTFQLSDSFIALNSMELGTSQEKFLESQMLDMNKWLNDGAMH